jgi:hypothetical protein
MSYPGGDTTTTAPTTTQPPTTTTTCPELTIPPCNCTNVTDASVQSPRDASVTPLVYILPPIFALAGFGAGVLVTVCFFKIRGAAQ